MPDPDDLSPLKTSQFTSAIEKLEELLTQSHRAFLIGAGCSKCANLPLAGELTEKAIASFELNERSKEILAAIKGNFDGAECPNIEDFLSELVDLMAIADRRTTRKAAVTTTSLGGKDYSTEQLHEAAEQIKRAIFKEINHDVQIDCHRRFVELLHRPSRPGLKPESQRIDYLVLNYDTLIECALAIGKVPYADGLEGGTVAWWNPETFRKPGLSARVLKLHGSIDWCEIPGEVFPRRIPLSISGLDGNRQIMIWPASTKYRETQRDPYSQLSNLAREILRPKVEAQRVLAICGYSFGDTHINLEIDAALRESGKKLTIAIFCADGSPSGQVKEWCDDPNIREQVLVFGRRGFWHGDDKHMSPVDLPWWKFENMVRILEGER